MMLFHTDGKCLKPHLRTLRVFTLLLTYFCRGQSQLIGSSIVATLGNDIILPYQLEPVEDATDLTVEWTRPDLNPRFVHVWRSGKELVSKKHKSFEGRTSLFIDELMFGNISLKLSKLKLADRGTYRCFIPALDRQSFVQLDVGAVSSPTISLAGIDRDKGGVVLQCESKDWYPEPEVLWLDGEGNLLPAGPSETVRGPDDLYTVSSRVTVEKRHSNSFTCRVQQKNTNQTRETEIHVPDDFFEVQSSSSVPINTGLAVSLAVCIILFILLLLFSVWKWRQNKINTKMSHRDEPDKEENRTNDPSVTAEETKSLTGKKRKKIKLEQQRREEAERAVQTLKKELETKKKEFESKLAEVQQQLNDEKQKHEDLMADIQKMKDDMQAKINELEEKAGLSLFGLKIFKKRTREEEQQKREEAVQILTQMLDEEEKQRSENQQEQLQKELEIKKDREQGVNTKWKNTNDELKQAKQDLKSRNEEISTLKRELWDEQKKKEETEKALAELMAKNMECQQQLQEEKTKRGKAEENLKKLQEENKVHESKVEVREHEDFKSEKDKTGSANQSSATGPVIVHEVGRNGKFIHLRNTSREDQELGEWNLEMQINDTQPITYTFPKKFKLKSEQIVNIVVPGYGKDHHPIDLMWRDLKSWTPGDKLTFTLTTNKGEIKSTQLIVSGR
ncbi:lamin-A-like [Perca fluviatilis]|uniref:lamin-A-like n=1 Tax=Perca fluviatilis TaxID=8168 RepID=UPI0019630E3D|nr:lamin-A-like [Perca fluviatilis]